MLRHFDKPSRRSSPAIATAFVMTLVLALSACSLDRQGPSTIWTDSPEVALYAGLFNSSQSRYRVEVRWKSNIPEALRSSKASPDLVVGRYLKGPGIRDRFQALDYLFGELTVDPSNFYAPILSLGNAGGRQLLLPVSFDLPAIVFARGSGANAAGKFLIGLDDMTAEAKAYNQRKNSSYTRMGFAPRWDPSFLVYVASASGAAFREGKNLAWNEAGLDKAVARIKAWTQAVNASSVAEDDFQFKYLYTPAYKYLADGRALFACMEGSSLFLVPEEKRGGLDYRWYAEGGMVPLSEGVVFAAIPRAGRDKAAAEAFLKWFFKEENQRTMLENSRKSRSIEGSFGIAGGFSALRPVTEKVFPLYYPSLIGHLPPPEGLSGLDALPSDWKEIKAKVLEPWFLAATAIGPLVALSPTAQDGTSPSPAASPAASQAKPASPGLRPGEELSARLADWYKSR